LLISEKKVRQTELNREDFIQDYCIRDQDYCSRRKSLNTPALTHKAKGFLNAGKVWGTVLEDIRENWS
jgi:hypothetical protein